MNTLLKTSFIAAALVAAFSAQAVTLDLNLQSHGSYSQAGPLVSVSENVSLQDLVDDSTFNTVTMPLLSHLNYSFNAGSGIGSGSYSNGVDSLSFNFMFSPVPSLNVPSGSVSGNANWVLTGATGAFSNYTIGSGTLSATYSPKIRRTALTSFSGQIQSVPEPTSLAAIGIGIAGIMRRRKKA